MSSIVGIVKQIAEAEVKKLHTLELGVVESVNIHRTEDDIINYDCSVILKGRTGPDGTTPLKIEHVPIATQHTGMMSVPYVNDLVLVSFINGNFELPVIIGRLYSLEKRSPLYSDGDFRLVFDPEKYRKEEKEATSGELADKYLINFKGMPKEGEYKNEFRMEFRDGTRVFVDSSKIELITNYIENNQKGETKAHLIMESEDKEKAKIFLETGESKKTTVTLETKTKDGSQIKLERGKSNITIDTKNDNDSAITVASGKSKLIIKQDGEIEVETPKKLNITTQSDVNVKCINCKIDASGKIDLGSGGTGVITVASHKCFFTGAPHVGSTTVKAKM